MVSDRERKDMEGKALRRWEGARVTQGRPGPKLSLHVFRTEGSPGKGGTNTAAGPGGNLLWGFRSNAWASDPPIRQGGISCELWSSPTGNMKSQLSLPDSGVVLWVFRVSAEVPW